MRNAGTDRDPLGSGGATGSAVRSALLTFTLLNLAAVLVIGVAALVLAQRIAEGLALDDARTHAKAMAVHLAGPLVDEQVRAGIPGASDRLSAAVESRMRDGSLEHAKIWDEAGRVIWSDQPELVGQEFDLAPEVQALFGTRDLVAEVSDLSREENVAERGAGELLEVYVGAFDRDGVPLVFEAYVTTAAMDETAEAILLPFAWLIAGALLMVLLIMLPFALSLSRRVERAQLGQASSMRHALLASELERRRIAEELHHGVVQELAGLGYTLPAVMRHLEAGGDPAKARPLVQRSLDLVQRNIWALRSLMSDIYPPDLQGAGLAYAVRHLLHRETSAAGLDARVEIEEELDIPTEAGTLAYRIIREGVHNVVKHAQAREVLVEVRLDGSDLVVRVADDGIGPGDHPGHSPTGHLGLRLVTDAVTDVGGSVDVRPGPLGGTSLTAQFPLTLVAHGPTETGPPVALQRRSDQGLSKVGRRDWGPGESR